MNKKVHNYEQFVSEVYVKGTTRGFSDVYNDYQEKESIVKKGREAYSELIQEFSLKQKEIFDQRFSFLKKGNIGAYPSGYENGAQGILAVNVRPNGHGSSFTINLKGTKNSAGMGQSEWSTQEIELAKAGKVKEVIAKCASTWSISYSSGWCGAATDATSNEIFQAMRDAYDMLQNFNTVYSYLEQSLGLAIEYYDRKAELEGIANDWSHSRNQADLLDAGLSYEFDKLLYVGSTFPIYQVEVVGKRRATAQVYRWNQVKILKVAGDTVQVELSGDVVPEAYMKGSHSYQQSFEDSLEYYKSLRSQWASGGNDVETTKKAKYTINDVFMMWKNSEAGQAFLKK